jgi:drug/metabolite transporter (DMT)-like permease
MNKHNSTGILLALAAILTWSTLALINTWLTHVPSFLILGVAFLISGSISFVRRNAWKIPLTTLLVGIAGIFGYHFMYFRAFTLAPAVEANLINYLWPLLIVVLTPLFFQGTVLRPRHILAAGLGLVGATLIVTGGGFSLKVDYLPGYLLALGAAVTWSVYSLLTKRLPPFGTESVAAFCAVSGVLSMGFYFLSGGSLGEIQTLTSVDWLLLAIIGIGPLGAGFYCWDAALKQGDPRTIGSLAYLTPLLSTLNLILFAGKNLTPVTITAMLLIIGGAVLGSRGN